MVNTENLRNFIKTDTVSKHNDNKKIDSSTSTTPTSNLPGVDNNLVLDSSPMIRKEGSRNYSTKSGGKKYL